jgi:hypothetical protein
VRENCLQDTFTILQHLVVPKAKHPPALARQISVTDIVTKAFCVLRTVGLDDQLSANAKKVDNVRSDRDLPVKLESAEATVAKKAPEAQFAVGRCAAHRSSARALVRRDAEIGLHRSSIGAAPLIRRAGVWRTSSRRKAPFSTPSPSGRRWPAKPVG